MTAALISAGRHAVAIRNAAGTVRNFGTLTSTGTYNTVALFAGGSVSNGSNASEKALISGSGSASGVDVNGATGTVTNFGTIDGGGGVALRAGGRVTNGSAAAPGARLALHRRPVARRRAALLHRLTFGGSVSRSGRCRMLPSRPITLYSDVPQSGMASSVSIWRLSRMTSLRANFQAPSRRSTRSR